jgi:hypothetical protein
MYIPVYVESISNYFHNFRKFFCIEIEIEIEIGSELSGVSNSAQSTRRCNRLCITFQHRTRTPLRTTWPTNGSLGGE